MKNIIALNYIVNVEGHLEMGIGQASRRRKRIETYNELKKKDVCTVCIKNKPRPNRTYCQECADKKKISR